MLTNLKIQLTATKLKFNIWPLVDWIFPPFCCGCGRIGVEVCPDCFTSQEYLINQNVCDSCGKPEESHSTCSACLSELPIYNQTRSLAVYQGITAEMIKGIKYNRRIGLAPYLTQSLVKTLSKWDPPIDLIAPVPLAKKRLRERGFNQADLIIKPVAYKMRIPYYPNALSRTRETRSQVGLGADERRANLVDAFSADPLLCTNKSVLLFDDITTTGTTLNECAKALKNAGAREVFCFTVASTKNQMMEVRDERQC